MAYPDKINALVDVTADQTLAAGGHAARHNDVNEALEEVRDVLGGGTPITATDAVGLELQRDGTLSMVMSRYDSTGGSPFLKYQKARGTKASPETVNANDNLGQIQFLGYSAAASNFQGAAIIRCTVDGTPDSSGDTSDMPGRLEFATTPDGSNAAQTRMRINNAGAVMIGTTTPGSAGAGDLVVNGGVFLGGSAAANELDDYEEGTFTPVVGSAGATFTYVEQSGKYIKVGKLVFISAQITFGAAPTGTTVNPTTFSGQPFAFSTLVDADTMGLSIGETKNINYPSGAMQLFVSGRPTNNDFALRFAKDAAAAEWLDANMFLADAILTVSGFYYTT